MHEPDTTRSDADSIVVGVDGSPDAGRALDWAVALAEREHRPLTLLHAGRGSAALVEAEAHVRQSAPDVTVGTLRSPDGPRRALIDASERASVVVLGARGLGPLGRLRLGSVAHAVSRHASCPVVVTRTAGADRPASVLAGIDAGPGSERVLDFAFRVARARGSALTVLHCFWDRTNTTGDLDPTAAAIHPEAWRVDDIVHKAGQRHPGVASTTILSRGFADRRLLAATLDHGLVVIGHQELPWLDALVYGHVSPVVVEHAVGDVAVVPLPAPPEVWP